MFPLPLFGCARSARFVSVTVLDLFGLTIVPKCLWVDLSKLWNGSRRTGRVLCRMESLAIKRRGPVDSIVATNVDLIVDDGNGLPKEIFV